MPIHHEPFKKKHDFRQRFRFVLFALNLFVFPGFTIGQAPPPPPSSVPEHGHGVPLRVTGDRDYPPYCFLDNGIPTGFDIDIIREIATALELELEIELKPWSEALHALESGRADVIPGIARVPSRENFFEFTTPTKQLSFALFVSNKSNITDLQGARSQVMAVQRAGVMFDIIRQQGILTNLIPVTDAPEGIRMLVAGKCDGALVNRIQGHYLIEQGKLTTIKSLNIKFPTIPYCLASRKGETELINILNEGLSIIKAEGHYDRIYEKWFGLSNQTRYGNVLRYLLIAAAVGSLLSVILVAINWSLRRKVQHRTSELRLVIDLIPHSIFARDKEGRYILVNQAMADSMGLSFGDIIGKKHTELFPADPRTPEYMQEDKKVFDSGQSMFIPETEYLDRNGKRRFIQVTKLPFRIIDGKPTSILCVAVDITQLKEAEEAVRSNRENLEITLNSIGDGVIAVDSDGNVVWINPVAAKLVGWSAEEAKGKPLANIISATSYDEGEAQDFHDIIARAFGSDEKTGLSYHLVLTARDGSQRDVSLIWSPIRGNRNIHPGLVFIMRDVTDELQLNKRLNETQKMESIGRLAGGVAHDFNNLLSGIVGYTELLNISVKDNDECRAYLKGIFDASERARELVHQLLTFSRRQPREIKPVNVHTVIGHVTSLLQHTLDRKITISRHCNASMFTVMGDRSQIQSALLNLGINSRDAMPSGGSLTIATRNVHLSQTDCDRFPHPISPGNFMEIFVTDTGIGMDRDTMSHIFEPFFTTKGQNGGTGLGLAAVYGTIKDHGGFIDVSSKPGQGTIFKLGIPVLESGELEEETFSLTADISGQGCILVVDDEPLVVNTMEAILRSLGYETLHAVNGREALKVFSLHMDKIDLVILDMIMPELNGEQTYRELIKIKPDVRVIISSGYLQEHNISDLMDLGILGVLQKPFRKNELAKQVSCILRFDAEN